MKIAFSGAQCVGKTTLIEDFLKQWPMYELAKNSYRNKAKEDPTVKLNQEGDEKSQEIIRDSIIDDAQSYSKDDKVIFDRCIFDNLAYSLWLNDKGKVSDNFINEQIPIIRESFSLYDIIFFIPITPLHDIPIVESEDGQRDLDPVFRSEIDHVMKAIVSNYSETDKRVFFPQEQCPAIIDHVFGDREQRIETIKFYVNDQGTFFGEEDSLLADIPEPEDAPTLADFDSMDTRKKIVLP